MFPKSSVLKSTNTNRLELRNRFSALDDKTDRDPDVNTKWEAIKKTYVDTSIEILGYR